MKKALIAVCVMLMLGLSFQTISAKSDAECAAQAKAKCAHLQGDDAKYNACWNQEYDSCMTQ